jgi:hypothetical protein
MRKSKNKNPPTLEIIEFVISIESIDFVVTCVLLISGKTMKHRWWAVLRLRSATAHPTIEFQESKVLDLKTVMT